MIRAGELTIVADRPMGAGSGFGNYIQDVMESQDYDFKCSEYTVLLCREDLVRLFEIFREAHVRSLGEHLAKTLWREDDMVFLGHIQEVPIYNTCDCKQSAVHTPLGVFPFQLAVCAPWENAYGDDNRIDPSDEYLSAASSWAKHTMKAHLESSVLEEMADKYTTGAKITFGTDV